MCSDSIKFLHYSARLITVTTINHTLFNLYHIIIILCGCLCEWWARRDKQSWYYTHIPNSRHFIHIVCVWIYRGDLPLREGWPSFRPFSSWQWNVERIIGYASLSLSFSITNARTLLLWLFSLFYSPCSLHSCRSWTCSQHFTNTPR